MITLGTDYKVITDNKSVSDACDFICDDCENTYYYTYTYPSPSSVAHSCCDEAINNKKPHHHVSFGTIHVREYERIIGDHPETKIGVPLSLGWGYFDKESSVPIDQYEEGRTIILNGNRRLSANTRKRILVHTIYGYAQEEIRTVIEQKEKLQKKTEKKPRKTSAMKQVGKQLKKILNSDSFIKGVATTLQGSAIMTY